MPVTPVTATSAKKANRIPVPACISATHESDIYIPSHPEGDKTRK